MVGEDGAVSLTERRAHKILAKHLDRAFNELDLHYITPEVLMRIGELDLADAFDDWLAERD